MYQLLPLIDVQDTLNLEQRRIPCPPPLNIQTDLFDVVNDGAQLLHLLGQNLHPGWNLVIANH